MGVRSLQLRRLTARSVMAAGLASAAPAAAADVAGGEPAVGGAANDRVFSAFIALGVAIVPEYAGSSRYKAAPLGVANVTWRGVELQVRGPEARLDVLGDSPWEVGPVLKYRGDRDDDVKGPVRRLEKLDAALDAGGFIGYRFGGDARGQGEIGLRLTALHGVAGENDGFSAKAGVSYAALRWGPLRADLDADLSYGSASFNRTYFGVTAAGAARSGLRRYRPDAGLTDVGAGLTLAYQFDERWGVIGRASVTRYVGEAADSSIVKKGSATAGALGIGVSYRY